MNSNEYFNELAQTVIGADEVADLAAPLRAALPEAEPYELFARICWSGLCEPGDRAAGALVEALGAGAIYPLLLAQTDHVRKLILDVPELSDIDWTAAMQRWQPRLRLERFTAACRHAAQLAARVLIPGDAQWPRQFGDLGHSAPHALWVRGQVEALTKTGKSVALVGSRAATPYGSQVTADLAAGMADRGFVIVSGGAYGVDAMAHRSALASNAPTVAVLAGGVDRLYPASNRGLFEHMMPDGAVVSELIVGQAPERWRFVQRNRLIAALAQVTCVVEAGTRSGALHTARNALELGRGVGAVPGPVTSAGSVGCHDLIRDLPVRLVTDADDLFQLWQEQQAFGWSETVPATLDLEWGSPVSHAPGNSRHAAAGNTAARPARRRSDGAVRILDALRPRARRSPEQLAEHAGMSAAEVRAALTELELSGDVVREIDGWRRTS